MAIKKVIAASLAGFGFFAFREPAPSDGRPTRRQAPPPDQSDNRLTPGAAALTS